MTPDSPLVSRALPSPNFGLRRGRAIDALVLHYTGMATGETALARLRDPASEVSCHYLVWEDGRIDQLVAEANRAWHAGRSFWQGERDMNAVSIGIELVNAGHDGGCPPYLEAQIAALVALTLELRTRHAIAPERILAHSDIAPDRKIDPGEWFPWERLAAAGAGIQVVEARERPERESLRQGDSGAPVARLQADLAALGFELAETGVFSAETSIAVLALQRHHRRALVDGCADPETQAVLTALLRHRSPTPPPPPRAWRRDRS